MLGENVSARDGNYLGVPVIMGKLLRSLQCRPGTALKHSYLLTLAFVLVSSAAAQTDWLKAPLITRPIDEQSLVALPGNTHSMGQPRHDGGVAPASMPGERLLLILRRGKQQEAALQSYLQSVQDKSSPNFRKFLTPDQFGKLYGPSDADLNTVEAWLRSHGFNIAKVSKGRTAIEFSGTVGQLQQTFHTSIHSYEVNGATHLANTADPMIPSALASIVGGIARLDDFKPSSQLMKDRAGQWSSAKRRFTPDLTINQNGAPYLFTTPGDAATIYDSPNSLNAHPATNQAQLDGTGINIGVAERTYPDVSNVGNYRSLFGLPVQDTIVVVDGYRYAFDPAADPTEALLDMEIAQGLAPGAIINLYTAADTTFQSGLMLAIYRAIDDNLVNILSVSFSGCEADQGAAANLEILNAWEQAAAQGIAVVVSTGDSGSAGCDDQNTERVAGRGLAVNALASTPYNIAVGGTDFNVLDKSFATYVGSSSSPNYTTAVGYIPEDAWNYSTGKTGLLSGNSVYTNASGHTNIIAGGGGISSLGDASGATPAGYPKPLWQQGFAASNSDSVRDLPDVSMLAGSGLNHAAWALCIETDCQGTNPTIHGVGGTSASAPAFAGVLAMVNQKIGASLRLGQANWVLYKLAQTTPLAFHSIAASNNSVYCSANSPDCGANNFLNGYNTASGYNLATGLGSVDITTLINSWASDSFTATITNLALDKTSFAHGTPVNISVGVTPPAATGNVAVINNASSQSLTISSSPPLYLPLISGSASGGSSQFPGGSYTVYGNYGGDGIFAGSTSKGIPVTVTPEDSVLQFSANTINSSQQLVSLAGATVPLGTYTILRAVPLGTSQASSSQPIADATGPVYFGDYISGAASVCSADVNLNATGMAEAEFPTCVAGGHSLTADYRGDLSYNASTAGPINFTVSKGSTSVTLTSDANSISFGNINLTVGLTPSWQATFLYPTGSVTFTDTTTNTILGTGSVDQPGCAPGNSTCVTTGLNLYPPQLVLGPNLITATYAGDTNYSPSAASAPFTVTCTAGCGNGTGQILEVGYSNVSASVLDPGGTLTATVDVGSTGGFSGAVNLTCSIQGKNSGDINVPTCSPTTAPLTVNDTQAAEFMFTIKTTAAVKGKMAYPGGGRWYATGEVTLACVFLCGVARTRRRWISLLTMFVCLAGLSGLPGCGGGSSSSGSGTTPGGNSGGTPGTTADTYTVTFHAVDAATGKLTAENYFKFVVE